MDVKPCIYMKFNQKLQCNKNVRHYRFQQNTVLFNNQTNKQTAYNMKC